MHATPCSDLARNPRLAPTLSLRAHSTAITAYTSAVGASFTMPASHMDCGADRWRTFLSNVSLEAAAFGFDATRRGSIAAKRWNARARAWAKATIGC